jgi:glc operon protein GlcG
MYQAYHLAHADAVHILAVVQKELEQAQKGAAVAIVDAQGELLAFLRTDGCRLSSITIAMNKAYTAAREQKESWAVGQSSQEKPFPMSNFGDPRFTGWGGGVPICYNGQVIGAIGISGLPEEEDMLLAQMGANVLSTSAE